MFPSIPSRCVRNGANRQTRAWIVACSVTGAPPRSKQSCRTYQSAESSPVATMWHGGWEGVWGRQVEEARPEHLWLVCVICVHDVVPSAEAKQLIYPRLGGEPLREEGVVSAANCGVAAREPQQDFLRRRSKLAGRLADPPQQLCVVRQSVCERGLLHRRGRVKVA